MDKDSARKRILESALFGPALKSRLVEELHNIDEERLRWVMILLDRAETAYREFGEASETYRRLLVEIEDSAVRAAEAECAAIFSEFEEQLRAKP